MDLSLKNIGFHRDDITDVFLTHLHFDHCGGVIKRTKEGLLIPAFKNANYSQGIELGLDAILDTLSGEHIIEKTSVMENDLFENINSISFIVIFVLISLWEIISAKEPHGIRLYISIVVATIVAIIVHQLLHNFMTSLIVWLIVFMQIYTFGRNSLSSSSSSGYGSSSSGISFSGFSGGGGSFGGGGASGSW